jgi:serine protease Do
MDTTHDIQRVTVVIYNRTRESSMLGSGVVIVLGDRHVVLTCAHCVENVKNITLETFDGRMLASKVIALDEEADVALLDLPRGHDLPAAAVGDSNTVSTRDTVFAVGTPLDSDLKFSVTRGSISHLERFSLSFLPSFQTDAAINPGNSGGGLFNKNGELIGINASTMESTAGSLGFSLKINDVTRVADGLMTTGSTSRPDVYFSGKDLNHVLANALGLDRPWGFVVDDISARCPTKGHLHLGDVILALNDIPVVNSAVLIYLLQRLSGDTVTFTVLRGTRQMRLDIVIPERRQPSSHALEYNNYGLVLIDPPGPGIRVVSVEAGSPAEDSGIASGDILLKIRSAETGRWRKITGLKQFLREARKHRHKPVALVVDADGHETFKAMRRKPR